jgi:hypothetical protein
MNSKEAERPERRHRSLLSGIVGLGITVGGAVFWAVTGRQSDLIMGSGLFLALGGSLSDQFTEWVSRISDLLYYSAEKERSAKKSHDEPDE